MFKNKNFRLDASAFTRSEQTTRSESGKIRPLWKLLVLVLVLVLLTHLSINSFTRRPRHFLLCWVQVASS